MRVYSKEYRKGLDDLIKHVGHSLEILDEETRVYLKCTTCNKITGWFWPKPKRELTLREFLGALSS